MNEKCIEIIIRTTGCTREAAIRSLEQVEPEIAADVVQEPTYHLYNSRVSKVSLKESPFKDGTPAFTETFELASKKKVTTFHKGSTPPDHSDLEGKRVMFIITKQRLNEYSNEIEFSGRPATSDELKEIAQLVRELNGSNGEAKSTPTPAAHPEKAEAKPLPLIAPNPAPVKEATEPVGKPIPKKTAQG